jgi:hypothetical protein
MARKDVIRLGRVCSFRLCWLHALTGEPQQFVTRDQYSLSVAPDANYSSPRIADERMLAQAKQFCRLVERVLKP